MDIKLIAFDLDGTTLIDHQYLSPQNQEALTAAAEKGVCLVPASGRMRDFLPEAITALPGVRYAITANGAAVYDLGSGQVIYKQLIPNEKARQVQAILDDYDVYIEYYQNGSAITREGYPEKAKGYFHLPPSKWHFVEGKRYQLTPTFHQLLEGGINPEKINLPYLSMEARAEILQKLEGLGGLRVTSSIPDNLEINAAAADKGRALLFLADKLGFSRENVMALGDNGNDVTMLQAAGVSVAVEDGSIEALKAARFTTAPHDKDGVAEAIRRFVLGARPS